MQHVIKKKKKRGWWPKLAIRHGQGHQLIRAYIGSVLHSEALTSDNYHYTVGFDD